MTFKQYISLWICFLMYIPLTAQECDHVLQGKVLDFHDKTVLAGATILVLETGEAVMSDLDGNYSISGLCEGRYELEVSHPECRTTLYPVQLGEDKELNLLIEHHLEELEEVRVFGQADKDKTNSVQEVVLEQKVLEQYSAASLGDALKELSGVSSLNTGANIVKPVLHGLQGSRVLILNDGVRMQDMEWGAEHAPSIDINSAGSARLIKGAAALQYGGDAIGGVVVLEPERLHVNDTLFGQTMLSGTSNGRGGKISSTLTKNFENGWFVRGQASFKILGDQEAPDYVLTNTGTREKAAFLHAGKYSFEKGFELKYSIFDADIAILRASHIGNIDDLIRSINSGQPEVIEPFSYELNNPRQEVRHHLLKARYHRRYRATGKLQLQYDFQKNRRFEYDLRVGDDRNKPSIDLDLMTHTLGADFEWDALKTLTLKTGLMGRYQENFANPETGVRRLIPDYDKYDFAGFATAELELNELWSLDGGIRYDFSRIDAMKFYQTSRWEERGYDIEFADLVVDDLGTQLLTNPVFDFHNLSFSVGSKLSWDYENSLRINYTLAQRPPNPSELFSDGLHHSAARIELGDLRIGQETSHKLALSLNRNFDTWGFRVEPYVNFINDFILLEPSGIEFTLRGAFPVWEYRQSDARFLGLDVSGYYNWTDNFTTDHGFSLVKGTDREKDEALINMPPPNLWNRLTFEKASWNNFEFSVRSDYVFEQNEFPPNITAFSPQQQEDVLLEINTPPGAYHLLGLHSKAEFQFGKGMLTTALSVNNLLDTSYRDYLNRQRFFADNLGRNIIIQLKITY